MSIILAKRLASIKPSATLEITAKAKAMREEGLDVIGLGAGEPDFDTPDHIKKKGIKAIIQGHTKYTPIDGMILLKEAIIQKTKKENNLEYKLNEVIISTGAKQVLFNAFLATLDAGDEVIIPAPYWVSYPDMVLLAEGNPVIVKCDREQNFKLTPASLEKAITLKTKWVIINSPSNPTGMLYSKEELIALGAVLKKYPHVMIMSDDIYEYLIYDHHIFYTLPELVPSLKDRSLVVNGLSKGYAMTGWRIGWGCGHSALIGGMKKIQAQSTSNATSISQHAALAALEEDKEYLSGWLEKFTKRRDFISKELNACKGIECDKSQGTFYVYASCAGVIGKRIPKGKALKTDQDFCAYLLDTAQVSVVPGSAFGLGPYFRASYATSMDNIKEACIRIKKACENLRD